MMIFELVGSLQNTSDDLEALARLRSLIEHVMAEDKISPEKTIEDGRITLDVIGIVCCVMRQKLGDTPQQLG